MGEGHERFIGRRLRFERIPEEDKRACEFFYMLEFSSMPEVIPDSALLPRSAANRRLEEIYELRALLVRRLIQRARRFDPLKPRIPEVDSVEAIDALARISGSMIGIAHQVFRKNNGHFDLCGFECAFERFANGELAQRLIDGGHEYEPDSGYYFCFSELVFAATHCDVDCAFWESVANVLTRTLEIFLRTRRPPLSRRTMRTIVSKFPLSTFTEPLPPREIEDIRARYRDHSLRDLEFESSRIAFCAYRYGELCTGEGGSKVNVLAQSS